MYVTLIVTCADVVYTCLYVCMYACHFFNDLLLFRKYIYDRVCWIVSFNLNKIHICVAASEWMITRFSRHRFTANLVFKMMWKYVWLEMFLFVWCTYSFFFFFFFFRLDESISNVSKILLFFLLKLLNAQLLADFFPF